MIIKFTFLKVKTRTLRNLGNPFLKGPEAAFSLGIVQKPRDRGEGGVPDLGKN